MRWKGGIGACALRLGQGVAWPGSILFGSCLLQRGRILCLHRGDGLHCAARIPRCGEVKLHAAGTLPLNPDELRQTGVHLLCIVAAAAVDGQVLSIEKEARCVARAQHRAARNCRRVGEWVGPGHMLIHFKRNHLLAGMALQQCFQRQVGSRAGHAA